ncbi:hypothetical protein NS228_25510 [Methylobacterium indicum]|uniref:Sporulation protein n=1 Tax=Methylobacterium indicum TaxID=1775910 RepID=A0ABR5GUW0_9HYPH|nr:hypothetical protein [Methylobacterium indicum]KMO09883.1 hypothetical protein QR78_31385 [Methylobacterium indicum]KMO13450.1 hypothetical protein QR79_27235 [Methylobacterium indicum]KTS14461.1 hypothetical protein NS229_28225 [Methylobacterium indicum]KTS26481.1 hypothetical protein NS228_25510 [Methylobacterium indicum]KTS42046.1 hypothetical protein NS230_28185 [Methylobacterium indicum]
MWRLLLGGIKVIIAIAALTTAANWIALREKDRAPGPALASVIDPPTTGAIAPRRADKAPAVLDQRSLGRLMSEASGERRR